MPERRQGLKRAAVPESHGAEAGGSDGRTGDHGPLAVQHGPLLAGRLQQLQHGPAGPGRAGDAAGGPRGVMRVRTDEPRVLRNLYRSVHPLPGRPGQRVPGRGQRYVRVAVQQRVRRQREPLPGAGAAAVPRLLHAGGRCVRPTIVSIVESRDISRVTNSYRICIQTGKIVFFRV